MGTLILPAQLATGLALTAPGLYTLDAGATPTLPVFPTRELWPLWLEDRPCVLRVDASDVVLDLNGQTLAVANDQVQRVVLVAVRPGLRNVVVRNGTLGRSAIALFFGLGCRQVAGAALTIADFAEAGVLAYAPQGFVLSDVVVGPNLTSLATSQETYALQSYGAAVRPALLAAWAADPDNLAVQEVSHLTGVAVVPSALADAPNVPVVDTSSGVVLLRVQVLPLQMYYREHSVRFAVTAPGGLNYVVEIAVEGLTSFRVSVVNSSSAVPAQLATPMVVDKGSAYATYSVSQAGSVVNLTAPGVGSVAVDAAGGALYLSNAVGKLLTSSPRLLAAAAAPPAVRRDTCANPQTNTDAANPQRSRKYPDGTKVELYQVGEKA
jgi:hypothetical protein